ncbi:hypothetical protein [Sphingomonas bacterium]|uniref:hypothetical protein n=1 Tax=Sphingomonas bacterium TaxID=1895847 RepID=UPI001575F2A0|nr:hypothetical protein [Sphingomonas bacterium]
MKISSLAAVMLVGVAGLAPGVALAQHRTVVTRTVTRTHTETRPVFHNHVHQECRNEYRHGHHVRVCRAVGY